MKRTTWTASKCKSDSQYDRCVFLGTQNDQHICLKSKNQIAISQNRAVIDCPGMSSLEGLQKLEKSLAKAYDVYDALRVVPGRFSSVQKSYEEVAYDELQSVRL